MSDGLVNLLLDLLVGIIDAVDGVSEENRVGQAADDQCAFRGDRVDRDSGADRCVVVDQRGRVRFLGPPEAIRAGESLPSLRAKCLRRQGRFALATRSGSTRWQVLPGEPIE